MAKRKVESKEQFNLFEPDKPVAEEAVAQEVPDSRNNDVSVEKETRASKRNYVAGKLYEVDCSKIIISQHQPRHYFDEEKLTALAGSISKIGMLQPVVCIFIDGELHLAAGERRLRAAREAGREKVPVWIAKGDLSEISLVENTLREGLTAVEEAEALQELKSKKSYPHEKLSHLIGKEVSTISEILAVAGLPQEIRDDCRADSSVPRDILVRISRLPLEKQVATYRRYRAGKLSRDQLKKTERLNKPLRPYSFVKTFTKRFAQFDLDSMAEKERFKLRSELETLQENINLTLEKLRAIE